MMMFVRWSGRRLRSLPRALPLALGGLLLASVGHAAAAPEGSSARRERLEEIWLRASGDAGRIRTVGDGLDDPAGLYHFGDAYCRRGHRLGTEVLRALQAALTSQQPLRIDARMAEGPDGQARRCVTAVAFFSPRS